MIGCRCEVCQSRDPRDQRSRCSVLIRLSEASGRSEGGESAPERNILIDTAPELRMQILRQQIDELEGVFYTHAHADHVFGLDDLRRFNTVMGRPLDVYAELDVFESFRRMFRYVFDVGSNVNKSYVPTLIPNVVEVGRPIDVAGSRWTPLRLMHGRLPVLGYRVDYQGQSLAYCTDVSTIPPETYPLLEDLDVLVIDGLRHRHHPTHMTVSQALDQIDRVEPGRAYLTHIAHDIRHAELEPELPEHVFLAFDGLAISCGHGLLESEAPRVAGEPTASEPSEPDELHD
jgi:phosphoribosyl 1,2-cyclic phosphate phosphodiesterase